MSYKIILSHCDYHQAWLLYSYFSRFAVVSRYEMDSVQQSGEKRWNGCHLKKYLAWLKIHNSLVDQMSGAHALPHFSLRLYFFFFQNTKWGEIINFWYDPDSTKLAEPSLTFNQRKLISSLLPFPLCHFLFHPLMKGIIQYLHQIKIVADDI